MHIETITIERSGALTGVTIDGLGPGVQVLHGTNETGKTSLLEFVRAMFFGFEGLFRRGVLDPRVPCAGRLVVHVGPEDRRRAIERRHVGRSRGRVVGRSTSTAFSNQNLAWSSRSGNRRWRVAQLKSTSR
jgi:uncharacterized protein YhaN